MNYVNEQNMQEILDGIARKIGTGGSSGALIGDTTPVGTIISFMGTTAPLYYLVCDGSTYNIEDYVELANFIEAQFGSKNYFGGDGTTTFAVPDLRGEFLRGAGTNSHANQGSGANVGVHQDGTEQLDFATSDTAFYLSNVLSTGNINSRNKDAMLDAYMGSDEGRNIAWQGSWSTPAYKNRFTSRPTNTSVLYCIKYTKAVIPSEYEDGTPVGRVIFDSILREGYIKANGAQIEDASISIPRLLSFVQKYSSQLIAPDQATYESNVGLYMYDSNNDILTLPNYIGRFLEGGNSLASIEAGLPNIKGSINQPLVDKKAQTSTVDPSEAQTSGSIYMYSVNGNRQMPATATSSWDFGGQINFDASRSSSIYNDSITTVQPSSITLIPQIRY